MASIAAGAATTVAEEDVVKVVDQLPMTDRPEVAQ
jgi:hypothetical protein